jgi:arginine/lysine/ornithine decarboxylase
MIVPYPPGIPIIMPGERFTASTKAIVDYLRLCEDFDNAFPGFENEIHGVTIEDDGKRKRYVAYCVC